MLHGVVIRLSNSKLPVPFTNCGVVHKSCYSVNSHHVGVKFQYVSFALFALQDIALLIYASAPDGPKYSCDLNQLSIAQARNT